MSESCRQHQDAVSERYQPDENGAEYGGIESSRLEPSAEFYSECHNLRSLPSSAASSSLRSPSSPSQPAAHELEVLATQPALTPPGLTESTILEQLLTLQHALLTAADCHQCYHRALTHLGEATQANRVYLVQLYQEPANQWRSCAYQEWRSGNTPPQSDLSSSLWAAIHHQWTDPSVALGAVLCIPGDCFAADGGAIAPPGESLPTAGSPSPALEQTTYCCPLVVRGQLYGAIALDWQHWHPGRQSLLQGVAMALSLKLEQLLDQVQRQRQICCQRSLNQLILMVQWSPDLSALFSATVSLVGNCLTSAAHQLGDLVIDSIEILQYGREEQQWQSVVAHRPLVVPGAASPPDAATVLAHKTAVERLAIGQQLQQLQLVEIDSTPEEPPSRSDSSPPDGSTGVWLMVPIGFNGKLWGSLVLHRLSPLPWPTWELEYVRTIAYQLAAAIQRSILNQRIQRLTQQAEELSHDPTAQLRRALDFEALLKRITERIRENLDENHILQTTVRELAIGLEVYSCDVGLYDLERQTSTICTEYFGVDRATVHGQILVKGQILDMTIYPEIYAPLCQHQLLYLCWLIPPLESRRSLGAYLSVVACPLADEQGVIGDLWLYSDGDRIFSMEEINLIQRVAEQCTVAVRQARLFREIQIQVRQLEQLNHQKDDFLNTVSHELRSPMANIEMAIQMLELTLFQTIADRMEETRTTHVYGSGLEEAIGPDPSSFSLEMLQSHHWAAPIFPPSNPATPDSAAGADSSSSSHRSRFEAMMPSSFLTAFRKAFRYFQMLKEECHRETNLINDLLDISRLEAGTEPIILTTLDLYACIPHLVEPFLERAHTHQQQIALDLSPDLPPLVTDLSGLERILTELLHNACKYTPLGGRITVIVRRSNQDPIDPDRLHPTPIHSDPLPPIPSPLPFTETSVIRQSPVAAGEGGDNLAIVIQVINSGVEISSDNLPKVFDKFYRIPNSDIWNQGGTGLGLALVKRLVEHLQADIQVASANQRVAFSVTFPLSIDSRSTRING